MFFVDKTLLRIRFLLYCNCSCVRKENENENENKLRKMMSSDEGDLRRVVLRVLRYDVDGVQSLWGFWLVRGLKGFLNTLWGVPSCILLNAFLKISPAGGRYCSYLLPRQAPQLTKKDITKYRAWWDASDCMFVTIWHDLISQLPCSASLFSDERVLAISPQRSLLSRYSLYILACSHSVCSWKGGTRMYYMQSVKASRQQKSQVRRFFWLLYSWFVGRRGLLKHLNNNQNIGELETPWLHVIQMYPIR